MVLPPRHRWSPPSWMHSFPSLSCHCMSPHTVLHVMITGKGGVRNPQRCHISMRERRKAGDESSEVKAIRSNLTLVHTNAFAGLRKSHIFQVDKPLLKTFYCGPTMCLTWGHLNTTGSLQSSGEHRYLNSKRWWKNSVRKQGRENEVQNKNQQTLCK